MTNDTDTIEREIFVNAPPEVVFRYLVEAEFMARWIGVSHELEPRPGGRFRVEISSGNIASGCYMEVAPHRRVAFTWGWESHDGSLAALPPGKSLVEIDLQAKDGGTLLRLRHSRLPTELGQIHGKRWSFYLGQLQSCASR